MGTSFVVMSSNTIGTARCVRQNTALWAQHLLYPDMLEQSACPTGRMSGHGYVPHAHDENDDALPLLLLMMMFGCCCSSP